MSAEVIVHCEPCRHQWTAAYLPMDARKLARTVNSARCPKCGEKKTVFVGPTPNKQVGTPSQADTPDGEVPPNNPL